jgi:hypothetical protein
MTFSKVVFPAPLAPTTLTVSPGETEKETSLNIRRLLYENERLRTSTIVRHLLPPFCLANFLSLGANWSRSTADIRST